MCVLINALCRPSFGAPGYVTKILQAKNEQKVDDFELIYSISIITDIDEKWFVISEHTIHWFAFGYVRLPQLKYHFSSFFLLFFFLFIILLRLSTFKSLNALYSKFERLKISGRTSARLKLGVPGWGNPPQTSSPNFEL